MASFRPCSEFLGFFFWSVLLASLSWLAGGCAGQRPRTPPLTSKPSTITAVFLIEELLGEEGERLTRQRSSRFLPGITRDQVAEPAHDVIRLDPLGLRVEVGNDAVPQHRRRHGADVLAGDVIPPVEHRPRLGPEDQVLRRPRTGPP